MTNDQTDSVEITTEQINEMLEVHSLFHRVRTASAVFVTNAAAMVITGYLLTENILQYWMLNVGAIVSLVVGFGLLLVHNWLVKGLERGTHD